MSEFVEISPTLDAYWRAIVLFGRNSASYKFALAKALLEIVEEDKNFIPLTELAVPFSKHVAGHLAEVDKQGTSTSSQFLDACRRFNSGEDSHDELIDSTVRLGFANVIAAFHFVNQEEVAKRFFVDERKQRGGIGITDELFKLKESVQGSNLPFEVESRWRLVETAWSMSMAPRLLVVKYEPVDDGLYIALPNDRRIGVTSSRPALNGYQKGKCFYCFDNISIDGQKETMADVDHFFPWTIGTSKLPGNANIDGVWNLVLSCVRCNRGPQGKFARVPAIRYLDRLHRRNNYLIDSHHPLRETLMGQTGGTQVLRQRFLQQMDTYAVSVLLHRWNAVDEQLAVF